MACKGKRLEEEGGEESGERDKIKALTKWKKDQGM
jgi:hypothetical protein